MPAGEKDEIIFSALGDPNTMADHPWSQLVQEYNDAHPEVEVVVVAGMGWDALGTMILAGNAPDQVIFNYIFDAQGQPVWTLGAVPNLNGGTMEQRAFFPHCPGCPAVTDFGSLSAGSTTTSYSGLTRGTHSTNIVLPAPLSGSWIRNNLPIQMLTVPQPSQSP